MSSFNISIHDRLSNDSFSFEILVDERVKLRDNKFLSSLFSKQIHNIRIFLNKSIVYLLSSDNNESSSIISNELISVVGLTTSALVLTSRFSAR